MDAVSVRQQLGSVDFLFCEATRGIGVWLVLPSSSGTFFDCNGCWYTIGLPLASSVVLVDMKMILLMAQAFDSALPNKPY